MYSLAHSNENEASNAVAATRSVAQLMHIHRELSMKLVAEWTAQNVPVMERQRQIGSSAVLAQCSPANVLLIQQCLDMLEYSTVARRRKSGNGLTTSSSQGRGSLSKFESTTSDGRSRPSSAAAASHLRQFNAIRSYQPLERLSSASVAASGAPATWARPQTMPPRPKIAFATPDSDMKTTPDEFLPLGEESPIIIPPRPSSAVGLDQRTTSRRLDDDYNLNQPTPAKVVPPTTTATTPSLPQPKIKVNEERKKAVKKVKDEAKEKQTTDVSSVGTNTECTFYAAVASSPFINVTSNFINEQENWLAEERLVVEKQEQQKREHIASDGVKPLDALFLLHCQSLIALEERAAISKNRSSCGEPNEEKEKEEVSAFPVYQSPTTAAISPIRPISAQKKRSEELRARMGMPSESADALDSFELLESVRRDRFMSRALTQLFVMAQIPGLLRKEIIARERIIFVEEPKGRQLASMDLMNFVGSHLNDKIGLKTEAFTTMYKIERDEATEAESIYEWYKRGRAVVWKTQPAQGLERDERLLFIKEEERDRWEMKKQMMREKEIVKEQQAMREQMELGNIDVQEAESRWRIGHEWQSAVDLLMCEDIEQLIRFHNFAVAYEQFAERFEIEMEEDKKKVVEILHELARNNTEIEETHERAQLEAPFAFAHKSTGLLQLQEEMCRDGILDAQQTDVEVVVKTVFDDSRGKVENKEEISRGEIDGAESSEICHIAANEAAAFVMRQSVAAASLEIKRREALVLLVSFTKLVVAKSRAARYREQVVSEMVSQELEVAASMIGRFARAAAAKKHGRESLIELKKEIERRKREEEIAKAVEERATKHEKLFEARAALLLDEMDLRGQVIFSELAARSDVLTGERELRALVAKGERLTAKEGRLRDGITGTEASQRDVLVAAFRDAKEPFVLASAAADLTFLKALYEPEGREEVEKGEEAERDALMGNESAERPK